MNTALYSLLLIPALVLAQEAEPVTQAEEKTPVVTAQDAPEQAAPAAESPKKAPQEKPAAESEAKPISEPVADNASEESKSSAVEQEKKAEISAPQPPATPDVTVENEAEEVTPSVGKDTEDVVIQDGISTLDQEGGNWLLKRRALEKTVDAIEQINAAFTKIVNSRIDFVLKRNEADKAFERFVAQNGFKIGSVLELLDGLTRDLEEERRDQGDLTVDERATLQTIAQKIKAVEEVRIQIEALTKLDTSLDEVLKQFEEEIQKSHKYQMKAWQNFQEIKKVLSDEKAEALFLATEGLYKNMQDIYSYLTTELKTYFDTTRSKLMATMASVQKTIDDLKQSGIELTQKVNELTEEDKMAQQDMQPRKPIEVPDDSSWFDSFAILWRWPIEKIGNLFS